MVKELVNILFTQETCITCTKGLWKKTDCDEAINHTPKILNEKHEHYVCSAKCDTPGYKIEVYKL